MFDCSLACGRSNTPKTLATLLCGALGHSLEEQTVAMFRCLTLGALRVSGTRCLQPRLRSTSLLLRAQQPSLLRPSPLYARLVHTRPDDEVHNDQLRAKVEGRTAAEKV